MNTEVIRSNVVVELTFSVDRKQFNLKVEVSIGWDNTTCSIGTVSIVRSNTEHCLFTERLRVLVPGKDYERIQLAT